MKADKVLRHIASFRQRGLQPVAEYVANLPSDMGRLVIDSLTLPERTALERLRKLRAERRRARAILEEQQHTACQEAEFAAFVGQLTVYRATGNVARVRGSLFGASPRRDVVGRKAAVVA
jgi:hypothetical protein